jgi:hypothetical protein
MLKVDQLGDSFISLTKSATDANRLYSILLDARASTVSESLYDTAERLLCNEKDNAKNALDQLWSLKKNMQAEQGASTVDMLIKFYQDKLDIVRNKEEHIRNISKDSRNLLEEKRKRDSEIASIRQQVTEGAKEFSDLKSKLEKLHIKEQELSLIEEQVKRELSLNENEVINGLYEIILTGEGRFDSSAGTTTEGQSETTDSGQPPQPVAVPKLEEPGQSREPSIDDTVRKPGGTATDIPVFDILQTPQSGPDEKTAQQLYTKTLPEKSHYPKSVVKTSGGKVIGEYFYDPRVYKNKRHYVFNSKFFADQLRIGVTLLEEHIDAHVYMEVQQMIQDAYKRNTDSKNIHFEISTNEILNDKTLRELWQWVKARQYGEMKKYANRLMAKINGLGNNYNDVLAEQFGQYTGS